MIDPSTINITDPSILAEEEQELQELGQEKLAFLVRLARRYLVLRNIGLYIAGEHLTFVAEKSLDNYTDNLLK